MAGTIILRLTYGYQVETDRDEFIELAERTLRIFHIVAQPGWIVDIFPFRARSRVHIRGPGPDCSAVRHVPSWFPFASFKRKANEWRKVVMASRHTTLDWARAQGVRRVCLPAAHRV